MEAWTFHVRNFALCSPILFLCGTCPNRSSATSPFAARDAAKPSPPQSEPCQTLGLLPTVHYAGRSAVICRQRYSGERSRTCCPLGAPRGGLPVGEMKRAIAREEQDRRTQDRFASTIVIAASIIAAVRLAREADISRPSPLLTSVVADSVSLARMILDRVIR